MWLSLVHAHNLLQSLIACHICWTVEKTFSLLIACNARLADAIAGMQIISINFRLNDLLEQLCRASICQRPFERFMKFQVFNDQLSPWVEILHSQLSPYFQNKSRIAAHAIEKRKLYWEIFPNRDRLGLTFDSSDAKRQFGLAESHWKPVRSEKTSCLQKNCLTAKTCPQDSCGNQCESSLA